MEHTDFKTNMTYTIFHFIFQFVSNRQKQRLVVHGTQQKNIETCLERELFLGMTVGFKENGEVNLHNGYMMLHAYSKPQKDRITNNNIIITYNNYFRRVSFVVGLYCSTKITRLISQIIYLHFCVLLVRLSCSLTQLR